MGAHSTLKVSRSAALAKFLELSGNSLSNEELEDVLFDLVGDKHLYNFWVVDDAYCDEDERVVNDNLTLRYLTKNEDE